MADTQMTKEILHRNPVLVAVFTIGIYGLYWLVKTTRELQANTTEAPKVWWIWLMLIPYAGLIFVIIYFWKYSTAINQLTGFNKVLLFVLWLIPFAGMIVSQVQLNTKTTV